MEFSTRTGVSDGLNPYNILHAKEARLYNSQGTTSEADNMVLKTNMCGISIGSVSASYMFAAGVK